MKTPLVTLVAFAAIVTLAAPAHATPWANPHEVPVAEVYDALYGTAYHTAPNGQREDLDLLLADHGQPMQEWFTASELPSILVISFDTDRTAPLRLQVGDTLISVFAPGPWTPPSRGLAADPGAPGFLSGAIDVAQLLVGAGFSGSESFRLKVGSHVLRASNSVRIGAPTGSDFLIGYNDGGVNAGDGDFNEPLFLVHFAAGDPPTVPEPGPAVLAAAALAFLRLARPRRAARA
jgi:hypothetical protein